MQGKLLFFTAGLLPDLSREQISMKAILVSQTGGPEQLIYQETGTPIPGDNEVLVKLKAIGINYIEIYIRTGLYKSEQFPYIPGREGCGEIVALGKNVHNFNVGDRVAFFAASTGSYAEYATVSAEKTVIVPPQLSDEIAAAIMLQGITAYYLSHITFPLNKNHTALIHAGAGGVGQLLIQMAKILGAKVISTVSTEAKAERAKSAGADQVINYSNKDFAESVMKMTLNSGAHVVYDAVGKDTFDQSLQCLTLRGMLVSYGQASGPIPPVELRRLAEKSLFITRPALHHYAHTADDIAHMSNAVFDYILHKGLRVEIGQRYALQDAAQAHRDLADRRTVGKSILLIS